MKCTRCGAKISGNFCSRCGTAAADMDFRPDRTVVPQTPARAKKPFYLRWWFITLAVVAVIATAGCLRNIQPKVVWEDIILGDILPPPPEGRGEIYSNSADGFHLEISNVSRRDYAAYSEACRQAGFVIDSSENSLGCTAYNAEGYKLALGCSSDDELSIRLEPPMELTAIRWPSGTAGQQLPPPDSLTGRFSFEYDDSFFVYIGGTDREAYAEYVDTCAAAGFTEDYRRGDDYYHAFNGGGWKLSLCYEGFSIISIRIDPPGESTVTSVSESEKTLPSEEENTLPSQNDTEEGALPSTAIRPEFKEAMDSYEDFMLSYVELMKKLESDPADLSLLAEYAEYAGKYEEAAEVFERWEYEDLTDAEYLYYAEVQLRINKKLLEIGE